MQRKEKGGRRECVVSDVSSWSEEAESSEIQQVWGLPVPGDFGRS